MSFNWAELVALAERWDALGPVDEATERAIISRAYYGAFNSARDRLGARISGNISIHFQVIQAYKASNDKLERTVGSWLDSLRRQRVKADYEADFNPRGAGKRALTEARKVLDKLSQCKR